MDNELFSAFMPLKSNMQELNRHGSDEFPIQYYVNKITADGAGDVPLHWHPRPEIFCVKGGTVKAHVGTAELLLRDGEALFINANELHSYSSGGKDSLCPDIVFSEELIAPLGSAVNKLYIAPIMLNERVPFVKLAPDISWQEDALHRLDTVYSLLQRYGKRGVYGEPERVNYSASARESAAYEMEVQREVSAVMQALYEHLSECEQSPVAKNKRTLRIRMQKMVNFIAENYGSDITLNDIAAAANISRSEASRCFQCFLSTSPVSYLLDVRIQKAMQLLRMSDMTVEAVGMECAFGSAAYFCKIFRARTGMTPKQYRAQNS